MACRVSPPWDAITGRVANVIDRALDDDFTALLHGRSRVVACEVGVDEGEKGVAIEGGAAMAPVLGCRDFGDAGCGAVVSSGEVDRSSAVGVEIAEEDAGGLGLGVGPVGSEGFDGNPQMGPRSQGGSPLGHRLGNRPRRHANLMAAPRPSRRRGWW